MFHFPKHILRHSLLPMTACKQPTNKLEIFHQYYHRNLFPTNGTFWNCVVEYYICIVMKGNERKGDDDAQIDGDDVVPVSMYMNLCHSIGWMCPIDRKQRRNQHLPRIVCIMNGARRGIPR